MVEQRNDDDEFQDCVDDESQSKCSSFRPTIVPLGNRDLRMVLIRPHLRDLASSRTLIHLVTNLFFHVMLFRVQFSKTERQELRPRLAKRLSKLELPTSRSSRSTMKHRRDSSLSKTFGCLSTRLPTRTYSMMTHVRHQSTSATKFF